MNIDAEKIVSLVESYNYNSGPEEAPKPCYVTPTEDVWAKGLVERLNEFSRVPLCEIEKYKLALARECTADNSLVAVLIDTIWDVIAKQASNE